MSRRTQRFLAASFLGVALLAASPIEAQIPGLPASPTPATDITGDPYKRETPYGAFLGFMRAAARENWTTAAEYLQWPKGSRTSREEMARQLKAVVDERFMGTSRD